MLYKYIKKFCFINIILVILITVTILLFNFTLPDRFYSNSNDNILFSSSYGKFLSFSTNKNDTKAAISPISNKYSAEIELFNAVPVKKVTVNITDEKIVNICGTPFGVKMFADGVVIVGFSQIITESETVCPAVKANLEEGDIIYSIDEESVSTNEDVARIVEESGGEKLTFCIKRNGIEHEISLLPCLDTNGNYKAGIWVRDSSAGIGTMTYYDSSTGIFAGLGHPICDSDTGIILPLQSGEIVEASITGIKKGVSGSPGELCGTFYSNSVIGDMKINNETGIYGFLSENIDGFEIPMANKQDVHEGKATIISTLESGSPSEYEINIEKINMSDENLTKNMIIKVTDEDLIKKTGGIVQGMSGSPIIQDGKFVGAVTHVFVSDPTKGYAIFAENMASTANLLNKE